MGSRRVRYDPSHVVKLVLEDPLLYRVAEVIYTSGRALHSTEVGRLVGVSQGYAYNLLAKLRRWGVLETVKDPANGKTMFRPSERKVARLLAEEVRKRRAEEVLVTLGGGEDREA